MSSEHGLTTREKAAATRRARRELLALIHAGHLNITDVLARTDDNLIAKTRVADLLDAIPGCDPDTRARALTLAGINDRRRVQGLAPWQRHAVLNALGQVREGAWVVATHHQRPAAEQLDQFGVQWLYLTRQQRPTPG